MSTLRRERSLRIIKIHAQSMENRTAFEFHFSLLCVDDSWALNFNIYVSFDVFAILLLPSFWSESQRAQHGLDQKNVADEKW